MDICDGIGVKYFNLQKITVIMPFYLSSSFHARALAPNTAAFVSCNPDGRILILFL